jgi:hypothetical protein
MLLLLHVVAQAFRECARMVVLVLGCSTDTLQLAPGSASSPDEFPADGLGVDATAAVDDDEDTYYWGEEEVGGVYILQLAAPPAFAGYSFVGLHNNDVSPKSWSLDCDGATLDSQSDYWYSDNIYRTCLDTISTCATLTLSVTDWWGASPAIREFRLHGEITGGCERFQ